MSRRSEVQVGVTVLVALAILLWGVTWLKEFSLERNIRVWRVAFPQTGGLARSDEVQVNGIRKGSVRGVALAGDRVVVQLALTSDVVITTESQVAIRNVGLMGEKVIAVDLRTGGRPYSERDTIPGIYEQGVPEVMADLGGTLQAISVITEQVQAITEALTRDGNFARAVRNFHATSEDLRDAVRENRATLRQTLADFSAAARTARGLTTDREAELQRAMDSFGVAAENMSLLTVRLDSLRGSLQGITDRIEQGDGTLGRLVHDDSLYREVRVSVRSLRELIADIKKHPRRYLRVSLF